MPNWVFNSLSVTGNELDLQKMMEQLNTPFTQPLIESRYNKETEKWEVVQDGTITYSNPVFAFWNIKRPTEDLFDEYFGIEPRLKSEVSLDDPNWYADVEAKRKVSNHWYDWNITNWGTKWEVAVPDTNNWRSTEIVEMGKEREEGYVIYRFDTAWSPPSPAIFALSEQYPNLVFDLEYEEEQGWGGTEVWQNGVLTSEHFYEQPASHQDYVDLDRECLMCGNYGYDEWYVDCPIPEGYEVVDGELIEKVGS